MPSISGLSGVHMMTTRFFGKAHVIKDMTDRHIGYSNALHEP
jgi:hypothetical protein